VEFDDSWLGCTGVHGTVSVHLFGTFSDFLDEVCWFESVDSSVS
jgi:hypothetical protein